MVSRRRETGELEEQRGGGGKSERWPAEPALSSSLTRPGSSHWQTRNYAEFDGSRVILKIRSNPRNERARGERTADDDHPAAKDADNGESS